MKKNDIDCSGTGISKWVVCKSRDLKRGFAKEGKCIRKRDKNAKTRDG